jgi:NitT/TauT family transport system permease protein
VRARRLWAAAWPKLGASVLFFFVWQLIAWSHWKTSYQLPPPLPVLKEFWRGLVHQWAPGVNLRDAAVTTLIRAGKGYAVALLIGSIVGAVVSQSSVVRRAVGSMIAGIQTMPSVAWFPLAIVLYQASEGSMLFIVVMGAAPSIAMGLISAVDQIPPLLLRASKVLGAGPLQRWRLVMLPASLPVLIGGLKQGWAFAWRSLLAAELLAQVPGHVSVGTVLNNAREATSGEQVMAAMLLIFVIGLLIDAALFGSIDRFVRRRHGLLPARA